MADGDSADAGAADQERPEDERPEDERPEDERMARRRRVVALIAALQQRDDDKAEGLIAELVRDPDPRRVIGSLGVAGSSMAETLSRATGRSVEELLTELEEKMTAAPTDGGPPPDTSG